MSGTLDSLIWLLVAVLLLLVLAASAIAARRYLLERGGGTVECALRPLPGGAWRAGVASYHRDELHWFRAFGVRLRPASKFTRRSLTVVSRREVSASETGVLGPGRAVVEIAAGPSGPGVELAMTTEALTGFLSWLEASPPSSHLEDIALYRTALRRLPRPQEPSPPGPWTPPGTRTRWAVGYVPPAPGADSMAHGLRSAGLDGT